MDERALHQLIDDVRRGDLTADEAVALLRRLPFADLGFARVDHHRSLRQGMAEAVYGPGKTPAQCAAIVAELLGAPAGTVPPEPVVPPGTVAPTGAVVPTETVAPTGPPIVLTRAGADQIAASLAANPGGRATGTTVVWRAAPPRPDRITVVTAGTADLPVADECAATLQAHGFDPIRLTDVGVSGLHRLLASRDLVTSAQVVVVVAGMEGALASVVAGLTAAPVVAVPTSVGYGASLEGVTALLAMLSSCAAGLTVVGIDNGFGAACAAVRMLGARGAPMRAGPNVVAATIEHTDA